MTLGFKEPLVPYVLDGTKPHSFRVGTRWKAGMRADLYRKVRQPGVTLLFRVIVAAADPMRIIPARDLAQQQPPKQPLVIELHGDQLSQREAEDLLWRDGFRAKVWGIGRSLVARADAFEFPATEQAARFWRHQLRRGPMNGQLISWPYEERFMEIPEMAPKAKVMRIDRGRFAA